MDRSHVRLVVACGLAVLAGCNGFAPAAPTPTSTPAPVPTPSPAPVVLAPGVTDAGVVDSAALARSHDRYLANRSYTLTVERTTRYANGTLRSQVHTRIRLARNRSYHTDIRVAGPRATLVIGEAPARAEFWSDGDRYLRAFARGNETTYNAFEPLGVGTWRYWVHFFVLEGRASVDVRATFGAVDTRVRGRTVEDGTLVVRVEGTGPPTSTGFVDVDDAENVRDLRVDATVDGNGVVRYYRIRYTATVDGERVRVVRTVRYSDVGRTTVGRPTWYDRAV